MTTAAGVDIRAKWDELTELVKAYFKLLDEGFEDAALALRPRMLFLASPVDPLPKGEPVMAIKERAAEAASAALASPERAIRRAEEGMVMPALVRDTPNYTPKEFLKVPEDYALVQGTFILPRRLIEGQHPMIRKTDSVFVLEHKETEEYMMKDGGLTRDPAEAAQFESREEAETFRSNGTFVYGRNAYQIVEVVLPSASDWNDADRKR